MSAPAPGARLTLISDLEDVQLQRVCDALDRTAYTRVSGRRAVRLLVEHHVDAPPAERTLDLVGHTCPDGLLLLGDWHLTEDAAAYFARLSDPLVALGVTRVRLLGCSTATTERGWRVLCALAGAVHDSISLWGSVRTLDADDYDRAGFVADDALVRAPRRATAERPPGLDRYM